MKNRYIDFIPVTHSTKKPQSHPKEVKTRVEPIPHAEVIYQEKTVTVKTTPKVAPKVPEFANYKTPKNPFINTAVEKRPLSKNVYKPNVAPTKEDTTPFRIIEKPKKDSKVGTVITVILTIILGAAVGTVAFLLLPH